MDIQLNIKVKDNTSNKNPRSLEEIAAILIESVERGKNEIRQFDDIEIEEVTLIPAPAPTSIPTASQVLPPSGQA